MYINDALILQGIKAWDTLTYMHMIPAHQIFTPIYTVNYLLNFICQHKYTHTRTCFTIPVITNIFHMTKHKYWGGGVKIYKRGTIKYIYALYIKHIYNNKGIRC